MSNETQTSQSDAVSAYDPSKIVITIKDMHKWYGEFHVLKRHQPECRERGTDRHLRTRRDRANRL